MTRSSSEFPDTVQDGVTARALAARRGQPSHGVAAMADFPMLQALKRDEPTFRTLAMPPNTPPTNLHLRVLPRARALSPFTISPPFQCPTSP